MDECGGILKNKMWWLWKAWDCVTFDIGCDSILKWFVTLCNSLEMLIKGLISETTHFIFDLFWKYMWRWKVGKCFWCFEALWTRCDLKNLLNVTLNLLVDLYQNKTTEMETICEREGCVIHVKELRGTCFIRCEFVVLEWLKMFDMLFWSRRDDSRWSSWKRKWIIVLECVELVGVKRLRSVDLNVLEEW